jgi:hypothetical protein
MFELEREDKTNIRCQACGKHRIESRKSVNFYTIRIADKWGNETGMHLCSNCCNILGQLVTDADKRMYGVRVMSVDEFEERNYKRVDKIN